MGATRKLMSITTLGLVDFRSDKERAAAYGARTRREAIRSRKELQRQTNLMAAAPPAPAPRAPHAPMGHPTPIAPYQVACAPDCREQRRHFHTFNPATNVLWTQPIQ